MAFTVLVAALSLPSYAGAMAAIEDAAKVSPPAVNIEVCKLAWPGAKMNLQKRVVELQLLVKADGSVGGDKVSVSSGYRILDDATRNAVTACKFFPAMVDGRPVDAWFSFKYIWEAGHDFIAPFIKLNTCEQAKWPKEALRNKEMGMVTLSFLIRVDGSVEQSHLLRSSGFPLLDMAAKDSLQRCRFSPATESGMPVQAWAYIEYDWRIEN